MKDWTVVSFFTPDYEGEATELVRTLKQFPIKYDVKLIKPASTWMYTTYQKVPYIRKMLKKHSTVVWLDADARVRQYPDLFDTISCDMAATHMCTKELMSNCMYFENTPVTKAYLDDLWNTMCSEPDKFIDREFCTGDQEFFQYVLEDMKWKDRMRYVELPFSYAVPEYWGTLKWHTKTDKVIEQMQASRRLCPGKKELYAQHGLTVGAFDGLQKVR